MKSFVAIAVVLCAFVCFLGGERSSVSASPLPEYAEGYELGEYPGAAYAAAEIYGEPVLRQKRATCDLLSGFGLGHSLCAAHCIGHGSRGGYCDDHAVCRCR